MSIYQLMMKEYFKNENGSEMYSITLTAENGD